MNLLRAKQLMKEEAKKYPELSTWRFGFDRSVRRFGRCSFGKNLITISKPLTRLNEESHVLDTIRHEIAHALAGPGQGHNEIWRKKAIELGCNGERCYDSRTVIGVERPYIGTCPRCGYQTKKFRRKISACRTCCDRYNHGHFTPDYAFKWRINR